jgi:hypothetical protein
MGQLNPKETIVMKIQPGLIMPKSPINETGSEMPSVSVIYGGPSNKIDQPNGDVFENLPTRPPVALIYGGPSFKDTLGEA